MYIRDTKLFADIFGTEGPDSLTAINGDTVYALGGDDTIQAEGGTVTVFAGADNDTLNISGIFTSSNFYGDAGDDVFNIITYDGTDTVFDGGSGDDSFHFLSFPVSALDGPGDGNALLGGDGFDRLTFDPFWLGFDMLANYTGQFGGTFDITNNITNGSYAFVSVSGFERVSMKGGGFTDTLRGGAGNDYLHDGGHHNFIMDPFSVYNLHERDTLYGMAGDDVLVGTGGTGDVLDGGEGNDTLTSGGNYYVSGNGTVTLRESSSTLLGGAGNDSIFSHGNDLIQGGAGDDDIVIYQAAYADGGDGDDTIMGGSGNDTLIGGAGYDTLNGGGGFDIADYSGSTAFIRYDFLGLISNMGDAAQDTLSNIEAIIGTDFNDRLYGDGANNTFRGGIGNDALFGRNGDDTLNGNRGNDVLIGGNGADILNGGLDNDRLYGNLGDDQLNGGDGDDVLIGGGGSDSFDGGDGIDVAQYSYHGAVDGITASLENPAINMGAAAGDSYINAENLYGTIFDDYLYGDTGDNRLYGHVGDDFVDGGAGDDIVIGGFGDDIIIGGDGNDVLAGQAGADVFQFGDYHGFDNLVLFEQGVDKIEFTTGPTEFSNLTITQVGSHVQIATSLGTIQVTSASAADFDVSDFVFSAPLAASEKESAASWSSEYWEYEAFDMQVYDDGIVDHWLEVDC